MFTYSLTTLYTTKQACTDLSQSFVLWGNLIHVLPLITRGGRCKLMHQQKKIWGAISPLAPLVLLVPLPMYFKS